ncbi:MAG: thioredoxin [Ruminococcus sp.]|nr:thioredoxin [Ruminococcus sp.]
MSEVVITKENFDEEVRNYRGLPILLDFWAGWCGPCMMLGPVVAEIAEDFAGKVKVGKVNVDEQPELAAAFRVESIPLLVVVKDGAIVKQAVGYRSKDAVIELLGL